MKCSLEGAYPKSRSVEDSIELYFAVEKSQIKIQYSCSPYFYVSFINISLNLYICIYNYVIILYLYKFEYRITYTVRFLLVDLLFHYSIT